MREQTKRRVIGGAVLVALALIVPLALINFSQGPHEAMEVDSNVRVYEIEVPGEESEPAATESAHSDAGDINAEAVADVFPAESEAQPEQAEQEEQKTAQAEEQEPAVESSPTTETGSEQVQAQPEPQPQAEPQPKPEPESAAGAGGTGYVVQVGSFGQWDNAEKMRAKLAETQFNAFITEGEVDGATLYRVRVGPYQTNDQADAAAAQLREDGYKTQVFKQ